MDNKAASFNSWDVLLPAGFINIPPRGIHLLKGSGAPQLHWQERTCWAAAPSKSAARPWASPRTIIIDARVTSAWWRCVQQPSPFTYKTPCSQ